MKRIVSTLLVCTLALGTLSGCGKETKVDEGSTTKPVVKESTNNKDSNKKATEEKMTLTIFGETNLKGNPEGEAVKAVADYLGVNLKILPGLKEEQYNVKMATGDAPDYLSDAMSVTSISKLIDQDMLAVVDEQMVMDAMPRYTKWAKKSLGEDIFKYGRFGTENNYLVPVIWSPGTNKNLMGYREDWRLKLGIDVPTTLDEYEAMLRAFVTQDPDGNKKDDTYGVSTWTPNGEIGPYGPSVVWGAYGVYPATFYEENGKIIYGSVQPAAKDALARMKVWYEDGILDPEFMLNKRENVIEKWVSNKVGSSEGSWYYWIPKEAWWGGHFYNSLLESQPNAKVGTLAELSGPTGLSGQLQTNPNKGGLTFGKHMEAQPEKMKKYMEYFEYVSFYEEGIEARQYGKKGVTFNFNEETGVEWIPPYDDEKVRYDYGILFAGTHFNDYQLRAKYETPLQYKEIRAEVEFKGTGKYDVIERVYRPIFNEKKQILKTFEEKTMIDFITGAKPLSEFDAFVDEWMKLGGAEVLAEAQEAYKVIQ